jgi:hypothetical protein
MHKRQSGTIGNHQPSIEKSNHLNVDGRAGVVQGIEAFPQEHLYAIRPHANGYSAFEEDVALEV